MTNTTPAVYKTATISAIKLPNGVVVVAPDADFTRVNNLLVLKADGSNGA